MDYEELEDAEELKNVKPRLISILHGSVMPSNRQGVVIKSKKDNTVTIDAKITKFDDIKGFLHCEPMIAFNKDTDKQYYSNETVENACHWFMKNVGMGEAADTNHNFELEDGVYVAQCWVDKSEDAWVWRNVYDIHENVELMKLARNDEITGVSIAGTAEPVIKSEESMFNRLLKALKEHFEPKIIKEDEDMEPKIEDFLKSVEKKLPEMLERIEKAKAENEEVKKAEQEKIKKQEAEVKEKEALNSKVEELEKSLKETSEKLEKANKAIEDLEKQALDSSQTIEKQKDPKPAGEYDFLPL